MARRKNFGRDSLIRIKFKTRLLLDAIGRKNQTYDDIVFNSLKMHKPKRIRRLV